MSALAQPGIWSKPTGTSAKSLGGVTGVTGIGLYAEQGATDELIAIIRSANTTVLSAANTVNTGIFV